MRCSKCRFQLRCMQGPLKEATRCPVCGRLYIHVIDTQDRAYTYRLFCEKNPVTPKEKRLLTQTAPGTLYPLSLCMFCDESEHIRKLREVILEQKAITFLDLDQPQDDWLLNAPEKYERPIELFGSRNRTRKPE